MNSKVMVITGTSKGIGRGLAEYYIEKGYKVYGCSRGPSTITLDSYHHTELDITDESRVKSWIRDIRSRDKIDILLCNAGLAPANTLLTMTSGDILENVVKTNINGTFYVCRETARSMMTQRHGRIITISSMSVGLHLEGTSAYSASKSAIVEMTKILAKELAQTGITCNVIAPSMIMTDAVEVLGHDIIEKALGQLTIKRKLNIEEIANVVDFLISDLSSCITGQVIHMGLVN